MAKTIFTAACVLFFASQVVFGQEGEEIIRLDGLKTVELAEAKFLENQKKNLPMRSVDTC